MPLAGPIKPWTFYLSNNFPFIEKEEKKIVLIVCVDRRGGYGFLVNSDRTGQQSKHGGIIKYFSKFVTSQVGKNPEILKCKASITKNIQPKLHTASFISCDNLYGLSKPLKPTMFDVELFPATEKTKQAVIKAVFDCPALSKAEKQKILTATILGGFTKKP